MNLIELIVANSYTNYITFWKLKWIEIHWPHNKSSFHSQFHSAQYKLVKIFIAFGEKISQKHRQCILPVKFWTLVSYRHDYKGLEKCTSFTLYSWETRFLYLSVYGQKKRIFLPDNAMFVHIFSLYCPILIQSMDLGST